MIARLSNMLQFYHAATSAMSPTIEVNDYIFSTNLVKPKRNDILVFRRITDEYDGVETPGGAITVMYRLLATGGEKIELKNGIAYVNGVLADDSSGLKFSYRFAADKAEAVLSAIQPVSEGFLERDWISAGNNEIALLTWPQYAAASKITTLVKMYDEPATQLYQSNDFKPWSINNYGPVTVPAGCYFVLGDNRHAARDSRFIGPVNAKDVTGVLLGKK